MLTRFRNYWSALPLGSRVAVVVWVAVVGGVLGRVAASKPRCQTVVPIYAIAGQRWLAADDVYAPIPALDVFRNPPVAAAGFAALTPLPEKVAAVGWRGLGAGVFLLGLWRFRRDVVPDLSPTRAATMFGLSAVVALPALNNGQVNLPLAGAVLNGLAAAAAGRWWAAAGWFGLTGWLKVYPLAVGGLACLVAPRRLGPRLAAVAAAGVVLPFLLQDPEYVLAMYRRFFVVLGYDDRTYAILPRVNRAWTVLPRVWLGLIPLPAVTKLVSLTFLAGAAVLVRLAVRRSQDVRVPLVLVLGLGSVWMTAFGPATEANTYSLLAGAAAYLVVAPGPRPRWVAVLAAAGYGLLAATVFRAMFPADWQFQVLGPQAVGAMLLLPAALAHMPVRVTDESADSGIRHRDRISAVFERKRPDASDLDRTRDRPIGYGRPARVGGGRTRFN